MFQEHKKLKLNGRFVALLTMFLLMFFASVNEIFAQTQQPTNRTPIGVINGKPVYADEVINLVNNNSPFMPPLDDEKLTSSTPNPNATPIATPSPRPTAPSFDQQIDNMMKTAKDWLFVSILNTLVRPLLPYLTFFAWIIASFVLIISFLRKFSDEHGYSVEQLFRWGVRTLVFMLVIGSAPYLLDVFTLIGKQIASTVRSANVEMVKEFDRKMLVYVRANFSVDDPNAIIAERLPNGEPGILGVINNKESSVSDITADLNFLNWNMPRMFTLLVISQNIIKFGGVLLALAGLFILIGLKLASPIMAALGFDDKFAAQTFYPFCWGVATFCLSYPIVKEVAMYIAYSIGIIALSIYNNEPLYTLDPNTAKIISSGSYDPGSSAAIVIFLFFIAALSYILSVVLAYKLLRGQVYESVNQISMGWMLSAVGTALETYGLVAGAAINRQAENTQIQGIYNSEKTNAKAAFDAGKLQTDARRVQSIAGVQGSLQTTLGQIYGNQTTNMLITNANRTMQIQQTNAMTQRELGSQRVDFTDRSNRLGFETQREKSNRWVENEAQKNENMLNMTPGSNALGTRGLSGVVANGAGELTGIPIDSSQVRQNLGNQVSDEQYQLNLGQNTRTLSSNRQNIENYQSNMETSINQNADANIAAINKGASISAGAAKQGAATQIGGINKGYNLEIKANEVTFAGRNEAALINKNSAEDAAHLRMVSTVVTGFFRDMDRRLEEMKPKY
ncbi:MAG TPA: hypothetical protein PKY82_03950 [Pyrinomonadaceae bacterium]|nr:hypothetical protein [Pyrinomonadaceae bacterium]